MEEVGGLWRPGLVVDFGVVDVRPALGDGAPRSPFAWRQAAGDKQVDDSVRRSRLSARLSRSPAVRPSTWTSSRRVSSPRPNNAALACSTASVACSPCTRVVSSRANRRCASRCCGRSAVTASSSASSSADRKVNQRRYRMTSASAVLTKYWYQAYGVVISGSSHRLPPPVDFPNFVPSAEVTSGTVRACTEAARLLTHQSDAGDDVAPLIGSADLKHALMASMQLDVVVGLQQHVAELRVGDPLTFQPSPNGVPIQHHVDREVFTDVAQQLDRRHRAGPLEVVLDDGARR